MLTKIDKIMEKHIIYRCEGVCAKSVEFDIVDGCISNVHFEGGCVGNQTGIAHLVEGMSADEVVKRLRGIDCRGKGTSCPDQLSKGILNGNK